MIAFTAYPLLSLFVLVLTLSKVSNHPNSHQKRLLLASVIMIIFGVVIISKLNDFEYPFILHIAHFTSVLALIPCLMYWLYNYFKTKFNTIPFFLYLLAFILSTFISLGGIYLSFFAIHYRLPFCLS
jgi:hypothetical protein